MLTHPHNRNLTARSQLAADLILGLLRSGGATGTVNDIAAWGHALADRIYEYSDQDMADFVKACEEEKARYAARQ